MACLLSDFLLYWLVPIVIGVFTWKALPRPLSSVLVIFTALITAWLVFLRIRRFKSDVPKRVAARLHYGALWCAMLGLIFVLILQVDLFPAPLVTRSLYLVKAQLNEEDLGGANLNRAKLGEANLEGAKLGGANLKGVRNLTCSQLEDATDWEFSKRDVGLACGADLPPTIEGDATEPAESPQGSPNRMTLVSTKEAHSSRTGKRVRLWISWQKARFIPEAPPARTGAVTLIEPFGSPLNLTIYCLRESRM